MTRCIMLCGQPSRLAELRIVRVAQNRDSRNAVQRGTDICWAPEHLPAAAGERGGESLELVRFGTVPFSEAVSDKPNSASSARRS